jgi:hypothetical protein
MKKASAADYDNGKDKDLHWLICNGWGSDPNRNEEGFCCWLW